MKYLVMISDGLSDQPIAEKDNKTPLQIAETPNLDGLAREGRVGSVRTIPESLHTGGDVSYLSLLGYDPEACYGGPAAFEARGLGIPVNEGEIPLCCDFIILQSSHNDMVMKDFTAGNLAPEDSQALLEALQSQIGNGEITFHPAGGSHNLAILKSPPFSSRLTPPNELIGEGIRRFMPAGEEFRELIYIMNQAQIILHHHPCNQKRKMENLDPVNSIWLWGNGEGRTLPPFAEQFGKSAAVITPSLLMKGMARSAGMEVVCAREGEGSPFRRETAERILKELETRDVVFFHCPAAEEVSLKGNIDDKVLALEDFDREVVGPLFQELEMRGNVKTLLVESHKSSALLMKYNKDEVPFLVYPAKKESRSAERFDEETMRSGSDHFHSGRDLIKAFLKDDL